MTSNLPPAAALAAWSWPAGARFTPSADGLINGTWIARVGDDVVGVLQRLNTGIFRAVVHEDIEAVTAHLASKGLVTPRLVPNRAGALWTEIEEGVFRVLTPVGRRTIHRLGSVAEAESAGALVGAFHRAVADLDWEFRHVRKGAHDTDAHVAGMLAAVAANPGHRLYDHVARLADRVAARWAAWDGPRDLPTRVIHGDLKVSNLRFDDDVAVALIDLDTLARGTLDVELGDALRSWCNRASEDATDAIFDVELYQAALRGYDRTGDATAEERAAIAPGVERIATELAARFAKDALEERYFGFDPRFGTRGDHNLLRARGQLSLAEAVAAARPSLEAPPSVVR